MKRRINFIAPLSLIIALVLIIPFKASYAAPDLIIINADIRTADPKRMTAQAIAIKDGKFFAIGSSLEIEKLKDKDTKVLDVEGKTILPGFIDSHTHLSSGAKIVTGIDLTGIANKSVWLEMIAERVKTMEPVNGY